jgi:CheY-like chemotaxis protein
MPEMNGIEAAKIIKRYRREVSIVIMSGYDFVKEKLLISECRFYKSHFQWNSWLSI